MPLTVIEEKMSRVSPQFIPELSAFVDFLLYRQGEGGGHSEQTERASFLDLLASAKLEDGELDLSRSRDVGRSVAL